MLVLDLNIFIYSSVSIDTVSLLQQGVILHAPSRLSGARFDLPQVLVFNDNEEDIVIPSDVPFMQMNFDGTDNRPHVFVVSTGIPNLYDPPTQISVEISNLVTLFLDPSMGMYHQVPEVCHMKALEYLNGPKTQKPIIEPPPWQYDQEKSKTPRFSAHPTHQKYVKSFLNDVNFTEMFPNAEIPIPTLAENICVLCRKQVPRDTFAHHACTEVHNTDSVERNETALESQIINRSLLLSHLLANNNQLSSDFLIQLQSSCSKLSQIIQIVKKGKTEDFRLKNSILYKVEESFGKEVLKLCLDSNTYAYLCSVLHHSGFHYNPDIIRCHLDRHFFTFKAKLASKKSHDACVACQLNLTPRKAFY